MNRKGRTVRLKEREITDRHTIDQIIKRCQVCRLALCDDGQPYVIPINFGYDGHSLYFHSATSGKKVDLIKRNNRVAFEFDILHEITEAEISCNWGTRYESVVGSGIAKILESSQDKAAALGCILQQYGGTPNVFREESLNSVTVFRVSISAISGKVKK